MVWPPFANFAEAQIHHTQMPFPSGLQESIEAWEKKPANTRGSKPAKVSDAASELSAKHYAQFSKAKQTIVTADSFM